MAGNDKPNLSDLKARLSMGTRSGQGQAGQQTGQTGQQQAPQSSSLDALRSSLGIAGHQAAGQTGQQQQVNPQQAHQQAQQQAHQQAQHQAAHQQHAQTGAHPQAHQQQQAHQSHASQANAALRSGHPGAQRGPKAERTQATGGLNELKSNYEAGPKLIDTPPVALPKGNSIFSPLAIGLMVATFVFGAVASYIYASGANKRVLYSAQIKDADTALKTLREPVNNFGELKGYVEKLDPKKVDFNELKKLGAFNITPDSSPFPSGRVLLTDTVISPIFKYLTDSAAVKRMIDDHIRLTTVDKAELEALTGDSPIGKYDFFAITYNFDKACKNGNNSNYVPEFGDVVGIPNPQPNSEGMYSVRFLSNGSERDVAPRFIVPIRKKDIVNAQGSGNALDRYTRRLEGIKRSVLAVDYTESMIGGLEKVAKTPEPGLF